MIADNAALLLLSCVDAAEQENSKAASEENVEADMLPESDKEERQKGKRKNRRNVEPSVLEPSSQV